MRNKIIAVQLPATCPMNCSFCRTPEHGVGDIKKVTSKLFSNLETAQEVYLTSNGETGFATNFTKIVNTITSKSINVSVLCATPRSVIRGIKRVEISYNRFTKNTAVAAIRKARSMNIPIIASLVDDGFEPTTNLPSIANQLNVDGVLVRSLQAEGRSDKKHGKTRIWVKNNIDIGNFPVCAYKELYEFGEPPICINHNGSIVPFLGG